MTTDEKGNFVIEATPNATTTVGVSYVGYVTNNVKIGGRNSIEIALAPTGNSLDQVVVVGYGTQKKSDVTGSVARVTGTTLAEVPTANFISELQGRTAGVDIVSNSASPGAGGQIRIRGNRSMATGSFTGATGVNTIADNLDQPLVVLDGIPFGVSVNDVDPDNIASLDILKDASATAIYGSRGSGGVILITTKRGRVGKSQMTYNGYYGVSSILKELKVFDGKEYAQFKSDAAALNSATPNTTSYPLTPAEQAGLAAGTNTDWQKLIYRNAMTTSNSLSLQGGTETTQFGLGASYYDQQGIIPNQNFERFQLRTTIDHRINRVFEDRCQHDQHDCLYEYAGRYWRYGYADEAEPAGVALQSQRNGQSVSAGRFDRCGRLCEPIDPEDRCRRHSCAAKTVKNLQ